MIAIGAGWLAGSIALVGFGLDSVIETIAALALYRRLRAEQAGATEEEAEALTATDADEEHEVHGADGIPTVIDAPT